MRKLLVVVLAIPLWAQQSPPPGQMRRGSMPEPKNLQVLKIPSSELMPTMRSYSEALGVRCDFCHVRGNFASDEKPQKKMARRMIVMTREINGHFPGEKARVTCYTCHRGQEEPKTAPPGEAGAQAAKPAAK